MQKSCSCCSASAEIGICFLLSTSGQANRRQKCSRSVPLCGACLRLLIVELGSLAASPLSRCASEAYTALTSRSGNCSDYPQSEAAVDGHRPPSILKGVQ